MACPVLADADERPNRRDLGRRARARAPGRASLLPTAKRSTPGCTGVSSSSPPSSRSGLADLLRSGGSPLVPAQVPGVGGLASAAVAAIGLSAFALAACGGDAATGNPNIIEAGQVDVQFPDGYQLSKPGEQASGSDEQRIGRTARWAARRRDRGRPSRSPREALHRPRLRATPSARATRPDDEVLHGVRHLRSSSATACPSSASPTRASRAGRLTTPRTSRVCRRAPRRATSSRRCKSCRSRRTT